VIVAGPYFSIAPLSSSKHVGEYPALTRGILDQITLFPSWGASNAALASARFANRLLDEPARVSLVAGHAGEMIGELTLAITNKLPMKAILISSLPLLEAKASSEIENIVTTTDKLLEYQQDSLLAAKVEVRYTESHPRRLIASPILYLRKSTLTVRRLLAAIRPVCRYRRQ
jgi:hypothetical protein